MSAQLQALLGRFARVEAELAAEFAAGALAPAKDRSQQQPENVTDTSESTADQLAPWDGAAHTPAGGGVVSPAAADPLDAEFIRLQARHQVAMARRSRGSISLAGGTAIGADGPGQQAVAAPAAASGTTTTAGRHSSDDGSAAAASAAPISRQEEQQLGKGSARSSAARATHPAPVPSTQPPPAAPGDSATSNAATSAAAAAAAPPSRAPEHQQHDWPLAARNADPATANAAHLQPPPATLGPQPPAWRSSATAVPVLPEPAPVPAPQPLPPTAPPLPWPAGHAAPGAPAAPAPQPPQAPPPWPAASAPAPPPTQPLQPPPPWPVTSMPAPPPPPAQASQPPPPWPAAPAAPPPPPPHVNARPLGLEFGAPLTLSQQGARTLQQLLSIGGARPAAAPVAPAGRLAAAAEQQGASFSAEPSAASALRHAAAPLIKPMAARHVPEPLNPLHAPPTNISPPGDARRTSAWPHHALDDSASSRPHGRVLYPSLPPPLPSSPRRAGPAVDPWRRPLVPAGWDGEAQRSELAQLSDHLAELQLLADSLVAEKECLVAERTATIMALQAASLALTHGDASLRRPEDDVACEAAEQRAWALCAALPAASGVRALLARSELLPHIKGLREQLLSLHRSWHGHATRLEEQADHLQQQLARAMQEVAQGAQAGRVMEHQVAVVHQQLSDQGREADARVRAAEQQLAAAREQGEARARQASVEAQQLRERLAAAEQRAGEADQRAQRLSRELEEQAVAQASALRQANDQADSSARLLRQQLEAQGSQARAALEARCQELERELGTSRLQAEAALGQLRSLEREAGDARERSLQAARSHEALSREVTALREEKLNLQVVVQEAERQLSGLSTDLDRVRWQQAALGTRLGTSSAVGAAAKPGALLAGYEHSRGGRGGAGGSPASASKGGGLGASPRGPRGAPPWGSRPGSAVAAGGGGGGAARAGAGHAHYTFGRLQ